MATGQPKGNALFCHPPPPGGPPSCFPSEPAGIDRAGTVVPPFKEEPGR